VEEREQQNVPEKSKFVKILEKLSYGAKSQFQSKSFFSNKNRFYLKVICFSSSANDYDDESKGLETITETVPESITTYLIYGVSMSKYDGMGLSDNVPSVTIFLPFFLSVEPPYSLKRHEVLVQDILIFNYLPRRQTVEVKITNNDGFEAVDLEKYGWKGKEIALCLKMHVNN